MEKKPRPKLTLPAAAKGIKRESKAVTFEAKPQAYVAPEPTEDELDRMTLGQRVNYLIGTNVTEQEWESEGEGALDWWPEDEAYDLDDGPIDDRATAAYNKDWQRSVPHDPGVAYGVEIGGQGAAMKELLLAVAMEVNRWSKPPKAEATAAGIGLAIAQIRGERGVKHPRDIAKEVQVRAQTLHKIKNEALQQIQRLNIASAIKGTEEEDAGTYNQSEEEGDQDDDPQFLLP